MTRYRTAANISGVALRRCSGFPDAKVRQLFLADRHAGDESNEVSLIQQQRTSLVGAG